MVELEIYYLVESLFKKVLKLDAPLQPVAVGFTLHWSIPVLYNTEVIHTLKNESTSPPHHGKIGSSLKNRFWSGQTGLQSHLEGTAGVLGGFGGD